MPSFVGFHTGPSARSGWTGGGTLRWSFNKRRNIIRGEEEEVTGLRHPPIKRRREYNIFISKREWEYNINKIVTWTKTVPSQLKIQFKLDVFVIYSLACENTKSIILKLNRWMC